MSNSVFDILSVVGIVCYGGKCFGSFDFVVDTLLKDLV
jgi:hypothetical protein